MISIELLEERDRLVFYFILFQSNSSLMKRTKKGGALWRYMELTFLKFNYFIAIFLKNLAYVKEIVGKKEVRMIWSNSGIFFSI